MKKDVIIGVPLKEILDICPDATIAVKASLEIDTCANISWDNEYRCITPFAMGAGCKKNADEELGDYELRCKHNLAKVVKIQRAINRLLLNRFVEALKTSGT